MRARIGWRALARRRWPVGAASAGDIRVRTDVPPVSRAAAPIGAGLASFLLGNSFEFPGKSFFG